MWFKLSQIYGSTISFAYFQVFFLKILKVKNFSQLPLRTEYGGICIHTKIIYDLTISIINKYFEFQNDWIEIIHNRWNCTQFSPIYHCVKEIKNFEQYRNFLSDMHQNRISNKLHQDTTQHKVSSVTAYLFLRYSVYKIFETDGHFLKLVKSCSERLKTYKSIKNWLSKTFTNSILSSYVCRRK